MESTAYEVRVACVQFEPIMGQRDKNVARTLELMSECVAQGATILVLPELASSGYVFESRDEVFEVAEVIPDGPACSAWVEFARDNGVYVVAGLPERSGMELFNSAILCGPDGYIGKYRKLHLWADENLHFEAGMESPPVFATRVGRLGVAICYDAWFPEVFRVMANQGADLVCIPFNNEVVMGPEVSATDMALMLCRSAAHINGCYIAMTNRIGTERGPSFGGQSALISFSGSVVAGPASADTEESVIGDIDIASVRRSLNWTAFNDPLRNRRLDIYHSGLREG